MEQRSLRLGDIVDDYCPRERRITNHAVVALVGDSIRQTRCSTCDTEHVYKEGRMPRKKLRKDGTEMADPDLAGGQLVLPRAAAPDPDSPGEHAAASAEAPPAETPATEAPPGSPESVDEPLHDGWLAHRPLIRAQLPRTEGELPPPRAIPEFTMHQRQARGARGFRQSWGGDAGSGFRPERNGNVAGPGHGQGQGPGPGPGRPGARRHRGGKHRRPR